MRALDRRPGVLSKRSDEKAARDLPTAPSAHRVDPAEVLVGPLPNLQPGAMPVSKTARASGLRAQ
eukprot:1258217-Pyramimonas_sp.AAC.1